VCDSDTAVAAPVVGAGARPKLQNRNHLYSDDDEDMVRPVQTGPRNKIFVSDDEDTENVPPTEASARRNSSAFDSVVRTTLNSICYLYM